MKDYYDLLQLSKIASQQEIKDAIEVLRTGYKKLLEGGLTDKMATQSLKELKQAEKHLLNLETKQQYDEELEKSTDTNHTIESQKLAFDYQGWRMNDATSWRDLVNNPDKPSVEIYRQLLRQVIVLPYPEVQENIILATLLTPTPLATMLPILFSWGLPATGKSNVGKLASRIYGNPPMGSTTTASAMNRILQSLKFDSRKVELPHMLVIDDINLSILRSSETIQQYLRSGFSRGTSMVAKAKKDDDKEIEYADIFGGRVISSCYAFFSDPDFSEISRRMFVIECRKSDSSIDILDPDLINWDGFTDVRASLWESNDLCSKFAGYRRAVSSYATRNKLKRPDKIALGKDVLASGITLGLWGTAQEALEEYELFLDSQERLIRDKGDIVMRTLETLSNSTKESAIESGIKAYIMPTQLKNLVEMYVGTGVFDTNIRMTHVNQVMRKLGWEMSEKNLRWEIGK
jgi:hypothetical protein